MGRGARLEAQGQVMSSGGDRERRWHAHSEPFNLPAVHVHPCGSQVPVCAVQPEPIEAFAAKHDERTHGGRARREWSTPFVLVFYRGDPRYSCTASVALPTRSLKATVARKNWSAALSGPERAGGHAACQLMRQSASRHRSPRASTKSGRAPRAHHPAPLLSLSASSRAHALLLQAPGASGTGSRLSEVDKYLLLGTPADGERQQSRWHLASRCGVAASCTDAWPLRSSSSCSTSTSWRLRRLTGHGQWINGRCCQRCTVIGSVCAFVPDVWSGLATFRYI